MTTTNATDPTHILSEEELAPLMERKRQMQAHLASQNKSSCSSGACGGGGGGQSSCSTSSAPSSPAADQPNVLKAMLIAVGVLALAALAWWGVTG